CPFGDAMQDSSMSADIRLSSVTLSSGMCGRRYPRFVQHTRARFREEANALLLVWPGKDRPHGPACRGGACRAPDTACAAAGIGRRSAEVAESEAAGS